jgi:hypothetical protein
MVKTYLTDAGRIGNGFESEIYDCCVRAYSIAKEIPYYEAHKIFNQVGRINGKGVSISMLRKAVKTIWHNQNITLASFVKKHPQGSYMVHTRKHAFAIKNSIVFDEVKQLGQKRLIAWAEIKS